MAVSNKITDAARVFSYWALNLKYADRSLPRNSGVMRRRGQLIRDVQPGQTPKYETSGDAHHPLNYLPPH